MRHLFHVPTNDATKPLCNKEMVEGDLIRMDLGNVDCHLCIARQKMLGRPTLREQVTQVLKAQANLTLMEVHRARCALIGQTDTGSGTGATAEAMRQMVTEGLVKGHRPIASTGMVYSLAEVEIEPGWRPEVVSELPDDEPEKMYLVCGECGGAFDTIETAVAHHDDPDCPWQQGHEYTIQPESEAM